MKTRTGRRLSRTAAALTLAIVMGAAACGGGDDSSTSGKKDEPSGEVTGTSATKVAEDLGCEDVDRDAEFTETAAYIMGVERATAATCFLGPDEVTVLASTEDIQADGFDTLFTVSMGCDDSTSYVISDTWVAFASRGSSDEFYEIAEQIHEAGGGEIVRTRC